MDLGWEGWGWVECGRIGERGSEISETKPEKRGLITWREEGQGGHVGRRWGGGVGRCVCGCFGDGMRDLTPLLAL